MTSSHISHKLAKGKNLWLYPYGLLIIVLLSILCFQLFDNANAKQSLTTTSHTPSLTQKAQPVADPGVTTQIFLPFVTQAVDNTSLTEEQPPQPIAASAVDTNYVGNSGIHPPIANNHTFVADTGGHLDQYLGRIDTANGRLTFPIAINGPVIEPLQVGSDGFPTAQAFVSLVDQQILPQYALLTLQVYDIDDELTLSCPQIDHIYVNGWQINDIKQGIPAVLRGGNEKWHIWTTIFPAYMLKYPTSPGINGQLPVAVSNEIAIAVDTACNPPHWKVEVDWVTISIESSRNYPLLFVHGWTGNVNTFSELAQFAEEQDIYTYTANLNFGIEPLPLSISLLKQEIEEVQTKYNADKVNLITHSRGGIFTRAALRAWPYLADSIQSYVTLSTPHHGVDAPESILSNDIAGPFDRCTPPGGPPPTGYQGDPDEYRNKCQVAAEGLRKDQMLAYNYGNKCRLERSIVQNTPLDNGTIQEEWLDCYPQWIHGAEDEVRAYTIVGGSWDVQNTSATFPWVAQRMGEDPFPEHAWVDGYFPLYDHVSITKDREVYDYVMDLIYSEPPLNNSQAAQVNYVSDLTATNEPVLPGTGAQTLFLQAGELVANQVLTFMMPLESVTAVDFKVLANNALSVTLRTPVGQLIDPSIADADPQITYLSEAGDSNTTSAWRYTYQVQNPATGPWEVQLTSLNAAQFVVHTEITSSVRLVAAANAGAYHPGETILVHAGLVNGNILQTGVIITGMAFLPDNTTLPLTFYDDGTHGDATANNHFFTAQMMAPALNGWPRLVLQATKGSLVRLTEVSFPVAAQAATFQSVVNETPVDTNDNGYYDALNLAVALNVQRAGDYTIRGVLADGTGNTVASASYVTINEGTPLAVGTQTVTLSFNGKSVRKAGHNGPYTLKALQIDYYDPTAYQSFTVDTAENVYTTNSYTTNQFEGDLLRVTGSSDGAEDANRDGIYDNLQISVTFDVLLPDTYDWIGELVDATGAHVTSAAGAGHLNSQTPAVFTFAGWQLINAGLPGPYRLTNVYVTKTTDRVFTQYFDNLHTTAAYQPSQFGTLPLLLANVQQQAFDGNNNGLYDALVVTTTVTGILQEGNYSWRGRLVAPNGTEVAVSSGGGLLYEGKPLLFVFLSPIIRNIGLNGPYTIRDITLTHATVPTITVAIPTLATTPAYTISQFDDWQNSVIVHSVTPVDVDGNSLYDRLEFSATVALPWSGYYILGFALTTANGDMGPSFGTMRTYQGSMPTLLTFAGTDIVAAGNDGPYLLKLFNVQYFPKGGDGVALGITHTLYTTPPYLVSQFQGFPLLPTPAAPVLLQPVNDDNDGNYTIEWSTVTDATGYELQERRGSSFLNPYITIYTGPAISFTVAERQPRTYYYRVRTQRALQNSDWSNGVNVNVDQATPTSTPTRTPTATPSPTNTPLPMPTATPVLPTNTPTPGGPPTDTPAPTDTPIPGATPTPTPIPTATPTGGSAPMLYLSSDDGGTVAGIPFADEDRMSYNLTTGTWALFFDGSDVGIGTDVNALHAESDGSLLLSFNSTTNLPGFGIVEETDIVRFIPASLGDTTSGSFAWLVDGSDVGLDTADEDIDAITRLPDGRLVISTNDFFNAGGVSGVGQDLFLFTATSLGETTSGAWELYFDGSDVGLSGAAEDIWGAEIGANGAIYLNTNADYTVTGLSGDSDDILLCTPTSLGDTTSCTFSLHWNGDTYGLGTHWLDALAIVSTGGAAPTATPTPGDTPTPTATPTATLTGGSAPMLYLSSDDSGTVGGVAYADEDILSYNLTTGTWALFFDGSDVGIGTDVDALHVESDGSLLLSFNSTTNLPSLGSVEDTDIVRFIPTTLGATTAGSFAWLVDGSDVGLDTLDEDIDAITRLPDGRLVISTNDFFNAGGVSGVGQDLFLFTHSSLGETTSGAWQLYFDGSDVGLSGAAEDIWGAEIGANGAIYLNTNANYTVTGLSGDSDDILLCTPTSLGDTTSCTFSLYWNGDNYGLGTPWLDALALSDITLVVSANEDRTTEPMEPFSNQVYLPLIQR